VEQITQAASDFSVYGLVMHADPVVKGVLVILVLASIACWAVILEKAIRIIRLSLEVRQLREAERKAFAPESERGLIHAVLIAAEREADEGVGNDESRNEERARLERAMRSALKTELQRLEVGLPFLATVGSTSPFIGLFGTVWGIVNSFTAIAQQKDTSLAVVAPGIAEALVATALGLAAAIPAVVAYNQIAVSLGRASARASTSITEIARQWARRHPEPVLQDTAEPVRAGKRY
jgi:biopolymer transport protein ExbB/TolQ